MTKKQIVNELSWIFYAIDESPDKGKKEIVELIDKIEKEAKNAPSWRKVRTE